MYEVYQEINVRCITFILIFLFLHFIKFKESSDLLLQRQICCIKFIHLFLFSSYIHAKLQRIYLIEEWMLWSSFTVGKREHEWALQNYAKVLLIFRCSKIGKKKWGQSYVNKWLPSLFCANFTATKDEKYFKDYLI